MVYLPTYILYRYEISILTCSRHLGVMLVLTILMLHVTLYRTKMLYKYKFIILIVNYTLFLEILLLTLQVPFTTYHIFL